MFCLFVIVAVELPVELFIYQIAQASGRFFGWPVAAGRGSCAQKTKEKIGVLFIFHGRRRTAGRNL